MKYSIKHDRINLSGRELGPLAVKYKIIGRTRGRVSLSLDLQECFLEVSHQRIYSDHQNLKSKINSTLITAVQNLEIKKPLLRLTLSFDTQKLENRYWNAVTENLHVSKTFLT